MGEMRKEKHFGAVRPGVFLGFNTSPWDVSVFPGHLDLVEIAVVTLISGESC